MSVFTCPVCGKALNRSDNRYICPDGHSFDIASKGYVNLLLSNHMNAKLPGDNKLMVKARADFLSRGYYAPLAEAISQTAAEYCPERGIVADAGCGEGYYTKAVYDRLSQTVKSFSLSGIDISKFACAKAAGRFKDTDTEIAVASIFRLPYADNSADVLITMFAPFCRDEFYRMTKQGGSFIMAIPGKNHLMGLKKAVYDKPYKNEPSDYEIEGFEFIKKTAVSDKILIDNNADIRALFTMTPYYYKTGEEGHRRVNELMSLETETEFEVLVYKKN